MKRGCAFAQEHGVKPMKKWVGRYAPDANGNTTASLSRERIEPIHLLLVLLLGIIIGGAMSLSVVTPERVQALQNKSMVF